MVRNRDSSDNIVTTLRDEQPGYDSRRGQWFCFSSLSRLDWLRGPLSLLFSGYRGLIRRGVKQPER
jgi:hypothetical protein